MTGCKSKLIRQSFWGCLILLNVCIVLYTGCKPSPTLAPLVVTKQDSLNQQMLYRRAFKDIEHLKKYIQTGDLVTRTGNDFTSESLRSLNQRNKTYSHCGIASIENDSLFIYHALGGEWNPDEKLRRDSWKIFAEPFSNRAVGIFQTKLSGTDKKSLVRITKAYHQSGLMFDMKFDLSTDERMYCAEFIYKVFVEASQQKVKFPRSKIGEFEFIGVDDIFLHPVFESRIEIMYK